MLAQERGPGREADAHLIDTDARGCLHAAPFVLPPRRNTVKVTALAALLVSAAALAQTPPAPSAAPTNEPKLRTDADIQREIDARVEAAKKELREEMRAQAATVSATNAGSTWETEATTHRKLDLVELHGYFRVRPELLHKLDLDQPPDASGYFLFPRPGGQY